MEFQKITNVFDITFDDKDLLLKNGSKFVINQKEIMMLIKKLELKHFNKTNKTCVIVLMLILL